MNTRRVQQNTIEHFWENFFRARLVGSFVSRSYIYKRYRRFINDPASLAAAILQEPLKITKNKNFIGQFFGEDVRNALEKLDRMNKCDTSFFKDHAEYHETVILYLINIEYIIFHSGLSEEKIQRKFEKIYPYIDKALKVCCASDVSHKLEDPLFELRHPMLYRRYAHLFEKSREQYRYAEKEAKKEMRSILKKDHMSARIQSRIKSIRSLYNKVKKKNILPSQIFDLIGLRILVKTEEECYRVLELLLENWSFQHARVKDYIAIPKDNGYQSIHVSGDFEDHRFEVQIRTYKMHHKAQYGQAAHRIYKEKK